jgi:mannose-6-phosphate isomerase-like protein (cupin superfamily)
MQTVSISNAEHYVWGEACDGWHLLKRGDMSVIQECIPAGGSEAMHYHTAARQFFFVLEGEATLVFEDGEVEMKKGDGLEIPPQTRHQFTNRSEADVSFLVLSVPTTRGDRVNV